MSSVARVTTITVRSETSFEDAVATGIARASETLRHVPSMSNEKKSTSSVPINARQSLITPSIDSSVRNA